MLPFGVDRVGHTSKRCYRRHEQRLHQLSHALLALVAIAKLAGPRLKGGLLPLEFSKLINKSRKRSCYSRLQTYYKNREYNVKSFFSVPGWAIALYSETSQAACFILSFNLRTFTLCVT